MKKFIVFTFLLCFSAAACFAQKSATPIKKADPKTVQPQSIKEISQAEWKILTDALLAENWNKSAALAAQYLKNLKTDNEKKQLARLRYVYLYSLAGKILFASSAKIPIETETIWKELDTAVSDFVGEEFILPPRRFLSDCKAAVNFICAVKDNERALRVTATNKELTAIHSFDYIVFDDKIALDEFTEKEIFIGGKLKRAEFNQDDSKPWVMRLIFEKGFVRVVVADDK